MIGYASQKAAITNLKISIIVSTSTFPGMELRAASSPNISPHALMLVKSVLFRDNLVALHFKYDLWHMTATAGSDVVQSGRPIFDDFFQHLWPYIGINTANVVFQMVKRLWLIRIDQ
ncbi:adhesion G protein-coupled receptor B2 [Trichonephila clavipes]|nr:adhesion G protein-coupled receptor B2 [Trichonephila clavipes]